LLPGSVAQQRGVSCRFLIEAAQVLFDPKEKDLSGFFAPLYTILPLAYYFLKFSFLGQCLRGGFNRFHLEVRFLFLERGVESEVQLINELTHILLGLYFAGSSTGLVMAYLVVLEVVVRRPVSIMLFLDFH